MKFIFIYLIAFIVTEALTFITLKLKWPDKFKDSTIFRKTPALFLGGTILFFSILVSIIISIYLFDTTIDYLFLFILSAGFFIMIIGLFEDLGKLNKGKRLFLEFLVFIIVILLDIKIKFFMMPSGKIIYLSGFVSIAITLIWFFLVTNFLSWFFELEGFISGAISIALIGILLLMKLQGSIDQPVFFITIIVLGSLLSIFRNEFYPAKILTGKSGSFLIGFLLGVLSLIGYTKLSTMFLVFLPVVLILIFIFIFILIILFSYLKGTLVASLDSRVFQGNLKMNYVLTFVFFLYLLTVSTYLISWYFEVSHTTIFLVLLGEVLLFTFIAFSIMRRKKKKFFMYPPEAIILNVKIDNFDYNETINNIINLVDEKRKGYVITANSLMVMKATENILFKRILNDAKIITPDGIGLIWASNFLGQPLKSRVTGIDLTKRLLRLCAFKGYRLFLLGSSPGITTKIKMGLEENFPGIKIVGFHHRLFSKKEEVLIIEEITRSQPDIIFAGLGSPAQEKWINRNYYAFDQGVFVGVGGSFDVLSGQVKRAPFLFQRLGLEWLYRLIREPYRWRRMMALPKFVWYILIQRMLNDAELND